MKILFAPFAAKLRNGSESNPKNYPFSQELVKLLVNHDVTQIGTTGEEQFRCPFVANLSFKEVCEAVKAADTFIAVDSYLQHVGWYVQKPGIVLWGPSDPIIYGHDLHTNLIKSRRYLREGYRQFADWESCPLVPMAFVSPEDVIKALYSTYS